MLTHYQIYLILVAAAHLLFPAMFWLGYKASLKHNTNILGTSIFRYQSYLPLIVFIFCAGLFWFKGDPFTGKDARLFLPLFSLTVIMAASHFFFRRKIDGELSERMKNHGTNAPENAL